MPRYQITPQASIEDWIYRHTGRIGRLKLVLKDLKSGAQRKSFQAELDDRELHLSEIKGKLS